MFIDVMYDFLRALQNDTCSISEKTFVICNVQSGIQVVNCSFFFLPWKACSFHLFQEGILHFVKPRGLDRVCKAMDDDFGLKTWLVE